jgi:hypothetical protein
MIKVLMVTSQAIFLAVSPSSPPQGSGQDDGQVNVSGVSAAIEYFQMSCISDFLGWNFQAACHPS